MEFSLEEKITESEGSEGGLWCQMPDSRHLACRRGFSRLPSHLSDAFLNCKTWVTVATTPRTL